MGTLRGRAGKWQSMIRIAGYPQLIKTFDKHEDAKKRLDGIRKILIA